VNTSRLRRLADSALAALADFARRLTTAELLLLESCCFPVTVVSQHPDQAQDQAPAFTLLTEVAVEAEPAEMLAAQQTETRPTAAVAATTR
jgi:hypothetical protein